MKPFNSAVTELALVFALVWGVLLALACRADDVTLMGLTLERASLGGLFASPTTTPTPIAPEPLASASYPLLTSSAVVEAPSTQPQRILLVGDSMLDETLPRFAAYAEANGHELFPAVWYGSTTLDWGGSDALRQLIREYRPTYVIVLLGSSELTARNMPLRRLAIERMLRMIGSRELTWIGPPSWRPDTGIVALLREVVGPARFFDSGRLSFERKRDGIHPNRESSSAWVDAVFSWVRRRHPIALEPPTGGAVPRPSCRVLSAR